MKNVKKILIACLCLLMISGCSTTQTKKKKIANTTKDTNSSQNVKVDTKSSAKTIKVKIGVKTFKMTLEDNQSTQSLLTLLPLELSMAELNGNEYYSELDNSLNVHDHAVTIKAGDVISIISESNAAARLFKNLGVINSKSRHVIILGGSKIAYYLAKSLSDTGIQVKIVESNLSRCEELAELLNNVVVIHGLIDFQINKR